MSYDKELPPEERLPIPEHKSLGVYKQNPKSDLDKENTSGASVPGVKHITATHPVAVGTGTADTAREVLNETQTGRENEISR